MMSECDYNAAAELFPARRRVPKMQPLSYKLFARASQAIRFAVGDIARSLSFVPALKWTSAGTAATRSAVLYEGGDYPLSRRCKRP